MYDRLLCPNCGIPISFSRTLDLAKGENEDVNVYQCGQCNVFFVTDDSLPLAGVVVH
jgi:hypothetical protein